MLQISPRVKPWRIRRLYHFTRFGIYDDDLLLDVGWGLFSRCQDVLMRMKARSGQVPCPQCKNIVYRSKYTQQRQIQTPRTSDHFACPGCAQALTWMDCKEALRNRPRCFTCNAILDWNYSDNQLSCHHCQIKWTWQTYRQSIRGRVRLPCPHCGERVSKPKRTLRPVKKISPSTTDLRWGDLKCPGCGSSGIHTPGKFQCLQCDYEKPWRTFVKRLKRRVEYLHCNTCNHDFTWQSWKQKYAGPFSMTGNPAPVKSFVSAWPTCKTPQEQMVQIDILLHALHGRGALAPIFIRGNTQTTLELLDELATA